MPSSVNSSWRGGWLTSERLVVTTLLVLLAVLWGGFLFHRSPRFPGSLTGGLLAVSAATLFLAFPIYYALAKRLRWLKQQTNLGSLLTWHAYTGALGAVLALLHTGHRFESPLGIMLTALMVLTTLSGYAGRHLLRQIAFGIGEKRRRLASLERAYNRAVADLAQSQGRSSAMAGGLMAARHNSFGADEPLVAQALMLTRSIADLEYSITAHERSKCLALLWSRAHLILASGFYVLLGCTYGRGSTSGFAGGRRCER